MKPEYHLQAFQERKETLLKWAVEVRGLENSQRIIGDNASKAVTELLSAYLHQANKVEEGFQLNHAWFKSADVTNRLPEFEKKKEILTRMTILEQLCEKLAYGAPKPIEKLKEALNLFKEIEIILSGMLK